MPRHVTGALSVQRVSEEVNRDVHERMSGLTPFSRTEGWMPGAQAPSLPAPYATCPGCRAPEAEQGAESGDLWHDVRAISGSGTGDLPLVGTLWAELFPEDAQALSAAHGPKLTRIYVPDGG